MIKLNQKWISRSLVSILAFLGVMVIILSIGSVFHYIQDRILYKDSYLEFEEKYKLIKDGMPRVQVIALIGLPNEVDEIRPQPRNGVVTTLPRDITDYDVGNNIYSVWYCPDGLIAHDDPSQWIVELKGHGYHSPIWTFGGVHALIMSKLQ